MTQVSKWTTVALLGLLACSKSPQLVMAPADPEATLRGFMDAVSQNSIVGMERLWGTRDGLASRRFGREELEQRLTVMRMYLAHDRYEVLPGEPGAFVAEGEREYEVRLTRKGCTPVVPFTMVRFGQAWLVKSVDLTQAGNPERICQLP